MKASIVAASRSLSFATDCLGAAFAGQQIAAVGRGQEILRAALDDAQAVIGELQIGDDLRVEQADGVGRDRIAEAGMEFLRHRGAADHLAALDHLHAQAGHREIGRAGEAVMARADDDNVRLVSCQLQLQEGLMSVGSSFRDGPKDADPESRTFRVRCFASPRNDTCLSPHCSPCRPMLHCAPAGGPAGNPATGARRFPAGVFMTSPDPSVVSGPAFRKPKPAGAGRLYRRDLRQRAAAVFGAAVVHQDGAAAARRLAGGVVGGDGVLPVAAARRLCLCAFSDAAPQPHDPGGDPSGAAGGRAADAAAVDRRAGGASRRRQAMRSGCSACSRSRSGCRSSRSPPTIRCCRPGSSAPAIPTAPILTSSMPPRISAASWRCCPIRCCWSRCSRCARRT